MCFAILAIIFWVRFPPCPHVFSIVCAVLEVFGISVTPFAERNETELSPAGHIETNLLLRMPLIRDERLLTD
jgi:hypothetical protein